MKPLHTTSEGFTIVEALVWLVVGGMMIAATSIFLGRGIVVSREQFQQVLTTEDARIQLERLPFVLRNARNDIAEGWLVDSHEYSITVLTNVDDDPDIERIRYFLEETELKRGETQPGEEEQVEIIARSLHNIGAGVPLLTYYDSNGEVKDPAEATSENIARLEITLIVDPDPTQEPGETVISSIIIPRGSVAFARPDGVARLYPVTLDLPAVPATTDTAEVTVTDLETGSNSSDVVYVANLNDGRIKTFTKNHYVNINYQSQLNAGDGTLPGWYAWVGPMLAGMSGGQKYYVTDKVPLSEVCQGSELAVMNSDDSDNGCAERTVTDSSGVFSVTYRPIFTYTGGDGSEDYIRNITYNHTGGVVSTLQNGLAGYWEFEEGGGTWVFDSTSNRNDAGFRNMETDDWGIDTPPTQFINRYVLSFDGVDEYLEVPDDPSLDLTSAITIAAWVNIDGEKKQGIVVKGDSENTAYSLTLKPNSRLAFTLNSTNDDEGIDSLSSVGIDGWHHVAATYDQTAGEQKLYIDGAEVGEGSYNIPIAQNNLPLQIGRYHTDSRAFNGMLDDVRVYNRALTAGEVSELANGEN